MRGQTNRELMTQIRETFETMIKRVEEYQASLTRQLSEADRRGNRKLMSQLNTGLRNCQELIAVLDTEVLDHIINFKNNTFHIEMAEAGKLL